MADIFGDAFSGTDPAKLAQGTSHDAGIRRHRNKTNLAIEGGNTQNTLIIGKVREGNCVEGVTLTSDVSLAAINFTVGTDADPTKYVASVAGPAANTTLRMQVKVAMLGMAPLEKPEAIKLFPSAALPATGNIVASVHTSKR